MHEVTFPARDLLLCGVQNFTLQLRKCRITGILQLTTSEEYATWDNQHVLQKAKTSEYTTVT